MTPTHRPTSAPATSAAPDRAVLFFDGECNLCHGVVRWVVRHERRPELFFCALQSEAAGRLLSAHAGITRGVDSLFVLEHGRLLARSEAAFRIARELRAPWRWVRLLRVLPRSWRDAGYDFIARRRHRWFGRMDEACLLPGPELRARVIDGG